MEYRSEKAVPIKFMAQRSHGRSNMISTESSSQNIQAVEVFAVLGFLVFVLGGIALVAYLGTLIFEKPFFPLVLYTAGATSFGALAHKIMLRFQ